METLRVNFLLPTMERNGGVRVVLNFARQLHQRGHSVTIVTGYESDWFSLPRELRVISTPRFSYYYQGGLQKLLGYSMRRELAHLESWGRLLPPADVNVATFATTLYPITWRSESATPFHHMQHMETLFARNPLELELIRASYSLPAFRVANSRFLAARYRELTGKEAPILNAAVEHEVFYPRKPIAKPSNQISLVALAKRGWKNFDMIVEAVRGLRSQYGTTKDIRLKTFVSRIGPQSAKIPKPEFVDLCLNLSDDGLANLYSNSDIQITASSAESFPLPPLEAMACGCPVVTTPFGTEDYAEDGVNCRLIKPGDLEGLKQVLTELINDKEQRVRLADRGRQTALGFDYGRQALLYEKYLKQSIAQSKVETEALRQSFGPFNIPV